MKLDSMTLLVRELRKDLDSGRSRTQLIRWVRTKGFSFPTARKLVDETKARAPWLNCYLPHTMRATGQPQPL